MDFKELRSDRELESNGVWLRMYPSDDSQFLIRSTDSPEYEKALNRISNRYRIGTRSRRLDLETDRKAMIELLAESVVLDWKRVKEDGVELPYSKESCIRLLSDFKDFYRWVVQEASTLENFQAASREEDEGN